MIEIPIMDVWSIDNEVIPLESAMMDIPNISITIRSCHDVQIVIIRNIVLNPLTVRSYLITVFFGCLDCISGYH